MTIIQATSNVLSAIKWHDKWKGRVDPVFFFLLNLRHSGCEQEIQEDVKVWLSPLHVLSLCCPHGFVSSQHVLRSVNQKERVVSITANIPQPQWSYHFPQSCLFFGNILFRPVVFSIVCSTWTTVLHTDVGVREALRVNLSTAMSPPINHKQN